MKNKIYSICFLAGILFSLTSQAQSYIISTVAGDSTQGYLGDAGPATAAELNDPEGVAIDASGNIYIADFSNSVIRKINTSGIISTFAGTGTSGYTGDGFAATAATLNYPAGIAVDDSGNVFIAEQYNDCIRKVNTKGIISTIAGNGSGGYNGDGINATAAQLNNPTGVAVDDSGNIYIADQTNNRIRKVDGKGIISTFVGNGIGGYTGDGVVDTGTELYYPAGVYVDTSWNVYIADMQNNRVRKVTKSGIISTIAGTGANGYSGDGGAATAAKLDYPWAVYADNHGNVYIADRDNNRIRYISSSSGKISTIAGNGINGYSGDGGISTAAKLAAPSSIAIDGSGSIYFGDEQNNRVRKLCPIITKPSAISGKSVICQGSIQIYSVAPVAGATSYTWTLPGGWIGSSVSDSITVTTGTNSGTVKITANNDCGPSPVQSLVVTVRTPQSVSICYVTVDTASLHNIIVWNKTGLTAVDSFKIYFYNSSNKWQLLTHVPFGAQDYYVDTTSINNPNSNTVRYCLTIIDSCGNEEAIDSSAWQNTAFIIGNGAGTFSWSGTGYLVQNNPTPVSLYALYRDTLSNGHWQEIDSVSGTQNQMTDPNYSHYPKGRWYVEARLSAGGCPSVVARTTSAGSTSSRSNIQHNTTSGINNLVDENKVLVYPNPAGEVLNIQFDGEKASASINIIDVTGRILETTNETKQDNIIQLNISNLPTGIYFVQIATVHTKQVFKFIKQ